MEFYKLSLLLENRAVEAIDRLIGAHNRINRSDWAAYLKELGHNQAYLHAGRGFREWGYPDPLKMARYRQAFSGRYIEPTIDRRVGSYFIAPNGWMKVTGQDELGRIGRGMWAIPPEEVAEAKRKLDEYLGQT